MLREALAPFYKSEQDMRRKLVEIEDHVEGNYDEQVRLRERVVALDDANMHLEKRVEDLEGRGKRRRISRQIGGEDNPPNGNVGDARRISNNIDERSVHSASSRALSPNSNFGLTQDQEEARSSGILNLVEAPRSMPYPPPPSPLVRRSTPNDREEPRSSGFLALDLAERMENRKLGEEHPRVVNQSPSQVLNRSPPDYAQSDPDQPMVRRSPSFPPPPPIINGVSRYNMRIIPAEMVSPRKRKHLTEHMALEMLADVSVASPLIH